MATYIDSWKGIIERMRQFCEGHYLFTANEDGNYPFTHGQPDIIDLDKKPAYPLMHVTPSGRGWDKPTKLRSFSMEIMFATLPYVIGDDSQPKQEHINEALSNTARLCEDLLALIVNGEGPFERGWFQFTSADATPFIDEQRNQLTGHILSLTLNVPYGFDACVVPGTWNMSAPSDGGGTSGSPKFLKSIAVSGQDTVQSTQAADTFTFAGSGITITTNPTTKVITFTATGTGISITYNTKATWESTNPVLAEDAIGIETGTNAWKIGDGATTWNNLEYMRASALHESSAPLAVENAIYPHGLLIVEEDTGLGKMGDGTTAYNSLPYLWVAGPDSSINERLAAFNGTSGNLLKDSGILISEVVNTSGLTLANDDIMQRKSGAWTNRTPAQYAADLLAANAFLFEWDAGQGGDTVALSTTSYYGCKANVTADNATESNRQNIAGRSCKIVSAKVAIRTTQSATGALVFTLRVNGSDTACVVTVPAGSTAGVYSDAGFTPVAIPAGALVNWKVQNLATTASAAVQATVLNGVYT